MNLSMRIILLTTLLSIAGCTTTPPTFGERMQMEGESRVKIAEQWEDGQKSLTKGEKTLVSGQKLAEKGRGYLSKGEKLVASGNLKIQKNKLAYQTLSQTVVGVESADLALKRVAKLKVIANEWEDGEDNLIEGNKLIKRGKANIVEGEANIEKGQKLITSGKAKMQSAESLYQSEG
ncbi:hypothetical protein [Psychromonas sp. SP041]|uniref:hypothetical protein n=1 Tax=Psychromonas sp. SP041 TaxID=1365007 RepID=UPI00040E1620|nr:hypothetical protein [Psychromonas sp. SP041]